MPKVVRESVVPAYPYDNALSALLHNSLVDSRGSITRSDGTIVTYNRNLFTPETSAIGGRAAAVAALFEEIVLSYQAVELPDFVRFSDKTGYFHPDLRLRMSFDAPPQFEKHRHVMKLPHDDAQLFSEWDHLEGIAISLSSQHDIKAFRTHHKVLFPDVKFYDLIANTVVQAYLANRFNAVLLGNDVFEVFYLFLSTFAPAEL
jgi:hypothetical protein